MVQVLFGLVKNKVRVVLVNGVVGKVHVHVVHVLWVRLRIG